MHITASAGINARTVPRRNVACGRAALASAPEKAACKRKFPRAGALPAGTRDEQQPLGIDSVTTGCQYRQWRATGFRLIWGHSNRVAPTVLWRVFVLIITDDEDACNQRYLQMWSGAA
jgi:hypothetical protein